MKDSANSVAVSWISFNHDPYTRNHEGHYLPGVIPGPTLEFLCNPGSPVYGQVDRLYLFVRSTLHPDSNPRQVHPKEEEVARLLREALHALAPRIEVITRGWVTDAPPTDHRAIFMFVTQQLA